tara:strand:+ start:8233 stop:8790 length:558 start_codon:yes stop_codon:yes gene_type:complete
MSKQQEMIKQLELLWSSLMRKPLSSPLKLIAAFKVVANQIGSEEFVYDGLEYRIKGYNDRYGNDKIRSINNKFEPYEFSVREDEGEELKEGVIYKGKYGADNYIFTAIRVPEIENRYFVVYGRYSHFRDMSWSSSGVRGWETGGNVYECAKQWLGAREVAVLKGYVFADPKTRTLNYSRLGFLQY